METSKEKEEGWNLAPTSWWVTIKERNIHQVKTWISQTSNRRLFSLSTVFSLLYLANLASEERELLSGLWSLWTFLLAIAIAPFIHRRFSVIHFQMLNFLSCNYWLEVNRKQIFHYSPRCTWLDILFFKCLFVIKVLIHFLNPPEIYSQCYIAGFIVL